MYRTARLIARGLLADVSALMANIGYGRILASSADFASAGYKLLKVMLHFHLWVYNWTAEIERYSSTSSV